jgi:hypothetical protein
MLVRVLKTCFADGGLRTVGTQFDWSGKDKAMGKHFSPVGDKAAAAEAAAAEAAAAEAAAAEAAAAEAAAAEAAAAEVGPHEHQTGRRKLTLKRVESDDIV